jgi:GntR family transcriptional regulator
LTAQRYEQIAEDLVQRIRSGEFPPGSRLPSRAELCREYKVSQSVVDKAMLLLRWGRWTVTQAGVAVIVRDPLPPEIPSP